MSISLRTRADKAHRSSVEYTTKDVARLLKEQLGAKLTAHIAGNDDAKAVTGWASGDRSPQPEAEKRLRAALQVFLFLQDDENAYTARAWLIGLNPQLEDEAPADVLREGRLQDVMGAARAYVAGG